MLFILLFQFIMSWKRRILITLWHLFCSEQQTTFCIDWIFKYRYSVLERRLKNQIRTTRDEKKLLTESTTNVLIETFDDSDDVSQNSESQVYNLLNNLARLVQDESKNKTIKCGTRYFGMTTTIDRTKPLKLWTTFTRNWIKKKRNI